MKTKPRYKLCRRVGAPIFEQCQTQRFIQSEARRARGSNARPKPLSGFGEQLLEKQKVRFSYGITEGQLANYVAKASSAKGKLATETLYRKLETRLDNVVYRLGFSGTRAFARQLVSHGHFTVNGKRVTVPSFEVKMGDVVSVREGSRNSVVFADFTKRAQQHNVPGWLSLDPGKLEGKMNAAPHYDDPFLKLNTVFEFYSR